MADVDPEVERLARGDVRNAVASLIPDETGSAIQSATDAIVGLVLADLRERYVLVPREGSGAKSYIEHSGYIHRAVAYGPWKVTSAPLSAQNGPVDSQGHPDRDDA